MKTVTVGGSSCIRSPYDFWFKPEDFFEAESANFRSRGAKRFVRPLPDDTLEIAKT
jgi:hypothetical protein